MIQNYLKGSQKMKYTSANGFISNLGIDMKRRSPEEIKAFVCEVAEDLVKWRATLPPPPGLNARGLRIYNAFMEMAFRPSPEKAAQVKAWEEEARAAMPKESKKRGRFFGLFGCRAA